MHSILLIKTVLAPEASIGKQLVQAGSSCIREQMSAAVVPLLLGSSMTTSALTDHLKTKKIPFI